jgi:hypothetical protein
MYSFSGVISNIKKNTVKMPVEIHLNRFFFAAESAGLFDEETGASA